MAHYLFLVLAMVVSTGTEEAQKQIDSLKIVASTDGVLVEATVNVSRPDAIPHEMFIGLKARASHATYDNKSGRLVLEGTSDAPVLLDTTSNGGDARTSARRVTISFKTGQIQSDGVKLYQSSPKHHD
jgi:hypothetical protein